MSALYSKIPVLLLCFLSYSSCERTSKAKDSGDIGACYALFNEDGTLDKFICDEKPIDKAQFKGEKGDRGPAGGQGPQGPKGEPGEGGGALKATKICKFGVPTSPPLKVDFTILTHSDDRREALFVVQTGSGDKQGVFVNSATYLPSSELYDFLPVDNQEFSIKLVFSGEGNFRNRVTGLSVNFACAL